MDSCQFPTSRSGREEDKNYQVLHVTSTDIQSTNPTWSRASLSWAILLSNYVRKEKVSFAVFGKLGAIDSISSKSPGLLDISVLQYVLKPSHQVGEIQPCAQFKLAVRDLVESNINTAVYFDDGCLHDTGRNNGDASSVKYPFDLILEVENFQRSTNITLKYRCPMISKPYAESIARSLRKIIGASSLGKTMNSFTSELVKEDKQIIISWNPKSTYHHITCMHHLIEATCRISPYAEAVCAWDGSLTYSQLDALSSTAAKKLASAGVKRGMHVPFAYEKSLWTVVATLGILKAGGSFVPLDPQHPETRILDILVATEAEVIVASDKFAPKFARISKSVVVISAETMVIPSIEQLEVRAQNSFYSASVSPEDPILVLFTSGSTGTSKGMVLTHGAICTHAVTHGEIMKYHGARVLQFAAHTFDVAIMDIFTTLVFGGCVCIPSEEDRKGDIRKAIHNMKANYAILTPSFAKLFKPSEVPTLKTLAIGGEALPEESLREWVKEISVIQVYGPAEVGVCLYMNMSTDTKPETVGYPLPNCTCWLVDPEDSNVLVPIGAVGELVVSSPSLAQGYLKNETKTRDTFIGNPTWADGVLPDNTRFCKTGDLLRYNTDLFDGSYDFIGRKDAQIKLRGQRIEPAEVEYHLSSLSDVAFSVVTRPVEGCFCGKLVAVVEIKSPSSSQVRNEPIIFADTQSLQLSTVQTHLSKSLPSYMVPTICLVIKSMPFVPSLKVDRRRVETWLSHMETHPLENLENTSKALDLTLLPNFESTAKQLSLIVAEIVASNDAPFKSRLQNHDFILESIGFDSIQITSLSMSLQREYGCELPLYRMIDHTMSIRTLARLVDHYESSSRKEAGFTINLFHEADYVFHKILQNVLPRKVHNHLGRPTTKNVFVTGASGYLGAGILRHLMGRESVFVYALVRCLDEKIGLQRLENSCREAGWWKDEYKSRIKIWKGDLAHTKLGLDTTQWDQLRGLSVDPNSHIHAIIHNGAKVHYSTSYEALKSTNIDPTTILLKAIALAPQIISFTFVSGGQLPNNQSLELGKIDDDEMNGYAQTKAVSEILVRKCAAANHFSGKKLCIVKPGYIIGSLECGIAKPTDFIWRLIASCVELRIFNKNAGSQFVYIADFDLVGGEVVSCLDVKTSGTWRVLDGLTFFDIWAVLQNELGYMMQGIDGDQWLRRMTSEIRSCGKEHRLFALLHMLDKNVGATDVRELDPNRTDRKRMMRVVKKNVQYLIGIGFFPNPPSIGTSA